MPDRLGVGASKLPSVVLDGVDFETVRSVLTEYYSPAPTTIRSTLPKTSRHWVTHIGGAVPKARGAGLLLGEMRTDAELEVQTKQRLDLYTVLILAGSEAPIELRSRAEVVNAVRHRQSWAAFRLHSYS